MARIASESKGGYYPTPAEEMVHVLKRIRPSAAEGAFNLLDPCAGTGEALRQMAADLRHKGIALVTYGIELEGSRAEKAEKVLDHCIHGGYESIRTEQKFNLLWLNPPYDDDFMGRVETTFLRNLTSGWNNVLAKGALLLYCIPQYVLEDSAGVLSRRFTDIRVYRFSDANYDTFDQVVVFGCYAKPTAKEQRETLKRLKQVSEAGPQSLPSLDEEDGVLYEVCPSVPVEVFRGRKLHPDELLTDLRESPVFSDVEKLLLPSRFRNADLKNPVLPLKPAHYGIAIAAGAVSGNMGNHIITGVTKRVLEMEGKFNEETGVKESEVYTSYHRSVIRVFTSDGVFDLE